MTLWEKAKSLIIDGTGTFSKKPMAYVEGTYPTHTIGGSGSSIIGIDRKRYTDWVCGLGANLIEINNSYSIPHAIEIELAEKVTSIFPCKRIKVLKTGSGACEAAIRYAIAHTKSKRIYGYSYHGWGNTFINAEVPGTGTYKSTYTKFTDLDNLKNELINTPDFILPAAVITEPCVTDLSCMSVIKEIRQICKDKEILFIADEIVSGGRTLGYCFSNHWELEPDIIILGKGLAGGYPISIVGVAEHIDTTDVFVSTTFSGDVHSMKACIRTLNYLSEDKIQKLWEMGVHLQSTFNALSKRYGLEIELKGYPTRAIWVADNTLKSIFWEQMLYRGHFCGAAFFISFSHDEIVIEKFLKAAEQVFELMSKQTLTLSGQPIRPPFRRN